MNYSTDEKVKKVCRRCKLSKSIEAFNAEKRNIDGKGSYCKPCLKLYQAESIAKRSAASQAKHIEAVKEWHRSNPGYRKEKYAENREAEQERSRAWYEGNKHTEKYKIAARVKASRWRQKINNAYYNYREEYWTEALEFFGEACCYCGNPEDLQRDHFIPVSVGGAYTKSNIVPACKSCNASKQDKFFETWYVSHKAFCPARKRRVHLYTGMKLRTQQLSIL